MHTAEELDRSVYRVSPDYPLDECAKRKKGGTSTIGLFISLVRARNFETTADTTLPYPITDKKAAMHRALDAAVASSCRVTRHGGRK